MKSCIVFGVPRAGNHLVMRFLDLIGLAEYDANLVFPYRQEDIFKIPTTDHYGFSAHIVASEANICRYENLDIVGVYISRNPEDIVCSMAHLRVGNGTMFLVDAIAASWVRVKPVQAGVEGWSSVDNVYSTTYEKLVGSRGGGTDEKQKAEIEAIISHIGIDKSAADIDKIQRALWSNKASAMPDLEIMARIGNGRRIKE